jgi:hypothetical protein
LRQEDLKFKTSLSCIVTQCKINKIIKPTCVCVCVCVCVVGVTLQASEGFYLHQSQNSF